MFTTRVENMYLADLDSIEGDDLSCLSAQINDAEPWTAYDKVLQ